MKSFTEFAAPAQGAVSSAQRECISYRLSQVHRRLWDDLVSVLDAGVDLDLNTVIGADPMLCRGAMRLSTTTTFTSL